ncbi:hypothetical protein IJG79_02950 [Candidatus Saccharibacteria bacterium]|nr:hypothetical protein [Candidatus Saccharibacteria bacterium]
MPEEKKKVKAPIDEMLEQVLDKIEDSDSILVTLSRDPSVDEMATALALTIALDGIGKHATAIYSGKTPNVIKFLKPEKTFETDTNSLQDFIIALNKEKADHLRYKVEGDFVKVYITPYKTTLTEKDLEFSRGDINVDLIISLNVTSADELDKALQEHGRILHDAVLINISNGAPGQIGGIEWNNDKASSVAEMATEMLDAMQAEYSANVATALLTGIIAATDRFSNEKTTPETMAISSRLMQKGADQQLIAINMAPKVEPKAEPKEEEIKPDSIDADSGQTMPKEKLAEEPAEPKPEEALAESVPEVKEPEIEPTTIADTNDSKEELTPEQELERMISGSKADLDNSQSEKVNNDMMAELVETAKQKEAEEKSKIEQQNDIDDNKIIEQSEEPMVSTEETESNIPDVGQVLSVQEPEQTSGQAPAVEEATPVATAPEQPNPVLQAVPATPATIVQPVAPAQPVVSAQSVAPAQPAVQPTSPQMPPVLSVAQPIAQPVAQPTNQPVAQSAPITANTQMGYITDGAKQAIAGDVDMSQMQAAVPSAAVPADSVYGTAQERTEYHDGTVDPLANEERPKDYGAMMEAALAEATPTVSLAPASVQAMTQPMGQPVSQPVAPAAPVVPAVPAAEQSVDDMVNQMVSQAQANNPINLPPPPTPPVDMVIPPVAPSLPPVQPITQPATVAQPPVAQPTVQPVAQPLEQPVVQAPAMENDPSAISGIPTVTEAPAPQAEPVNPVVVQPVQDPALVQPVQDPGAFKIPGM